ncbi:MAG TPA: substrate-binding domain-containing protein [Burkholderiaceae bacterium]|nr:substrate-binding domain-containing protein [Burkholderiaceae bacterium]
MRRSTLRDVAERAGVSVATVDRVLNGRPLVSAATVERVRAAARDLAYAFGLPASRAMATRPRAARVRCGILLQREDSDFYRQLAAAIEEAAATTPQLNATVRIDFCSDVDPARTEERLHAMAAENDALAIVAVDHPRIADAIAAVQGRGVAVVSLLTELSGAACRGHAGINNRAAGRTAAWAIAHCARDGGPVAVVIGSHGYLGQEDREIGLRSYLREHAPQFVVLEPRTCLDDPDLAHAAARDFLALRPAIAGLYCAGGGEAGVIRALREHAAANPGLAGLPAFACHELAPHTREALLDGTATLALAHDIPRLARDALELLAGFGRGEAPPRPTRIAPFTMHTSENVN